MANVKNKATKKQQKSPKGKLRQYFAAARQKLSEYLARRPHRSFRRTLRRDYARSFAISGYVSFTIYVARVLFSEKKLFGAMVLFYSVASIALIGLGSQDIYSQLVELLTETDNNWGIFTQSTLLLTASISGGLNSSLTEAQQIYSIVLLLLIWLTVVWALRVKLAGKNVKLREALYSSGAPIVATAAVALIIVVQLIPAGAAVIGVNAAIATGMFESPVMSMTVSLAAVGLALLSIYWITSSFIALVIVTLPGMYPWQAIRAAGDLVIGRRFRILLRLVWMVLCNALIAITILLPVILIDRVFKQWFPAIEWLPTVPVAMVFVTAISLVWTATYIYLLYRKVVEDDASPA